MYYRKVVFVVIFLLLSISLYSQLDLNSISQTEFNYFSIVDTLKTSKCDSIRFIVKNKNPIPKPVIVFIQGSGNGSLIIKNQNQSYSILESLIPAEYFEKYTFVLVSKPGVPVCEDAVGQTKLWNEERGDYNLFVKNDYKDYYVSAISPNNFIINIPFFCQAINYNTCLNGKVCIDSGGKIKNCLVSNKSFGNVKTDKIYSIISTKGFQKLWKINKDKIQVCKDCEFRYMCSDCRLLTVSNRNDYSKPKYCQYDPYTASFLTE